MLGPGLSRLLLDPAHPGGFRLHPDLLSRRCWVSGAGRRWQHDPGVEHTDHPEPVRHQVLLAGHQVKGHSGMYELIRLSLIGLLMKDELLL